MFELSLSTALFNNNILVFFIFNFCIRIKIEKRSNVEQFLVYVPLLTRSDSILHFFA